MDTKQASNDFSEHFVARFENFEQCYSQTLQVFNLENIHDLRVSIKRLRALLSLIELASEKRVDCSQCFILLGPIFKNAGYIRECQVNIFLLKQFDNKVSMFFRDYLIKKQTKAAKKLTNETKEFDIELLKKNYQRSEQFLTDSSVKEINKVALKSVKKRAAKIKQLKVESGGNLGIHRIRKHIKYIIEILELIVGISDNKQLKQLNKKAKLCANKIGEWHDYQVLLASFNRFLSVKEINNKASRSIIKDIETKSEGLMESINYHLDLMLDASKL
ncbi:MAG: CHAD domain-containing protein [Gammaproteobacteria bacterium]|nr:MAG: CHAD domain-containing protein [Gammaproteobacteria bacterium]